MFTDHLLYWCTWNVCYAGRHSARWWSYCALLYFRFYSPCLCEAGSQDCFADSRMDNPCIDEQKLEALVTPRTRAIVPVHYAGIACDMDVILAVAERHNLLVIEDAAQAIDSFYKGRPLGSIGHLAAFSFHETKNIQCGEGGLLAINDPRFVKRSEILWEKGTNRAEFSGVRLINTAGWIQALLFFRPSMWLLSCGHSWKHWTPSSRSGKRFGICIIRTCKAFRACRCLCCPIMQQIMPMPFMLCVPLPKKERH